MNQVRILLLIQSAKTEKRSQLQGCVPAFLQGADIILRPPPTQCDALAPSCLVTFDMILVVYVDQIQNPRKDVLQTCHELRRQFAGPILLISNILDEEFQIAGYVVGIDEYIKESTATRDLMLAKLGVWYNWAIAGRQRKYTGTAPQRQLPGHMGLDVCVVELPDIGAKPAQ